MGVGRFPFIRSAAAVAVWILSFVLAEPALAAQATNCSSDVAAQMNGARPSLLSGYGCDGKPQPGPEDIYEFACQTTGNVTVTLSGLHCDLDLYVLDDTCQRLIGPRAGELHV